MSGLEPTRAGAPPPSPRAAAPSPRAVAAVAAAAPLSPRPGAAGAPGRAGVPSTVTVVISARPEQYDRIQRKRELGLTSRPPALEAFVQSPRSQATRSAVAAAAAAVASGRMRKSPLGSPRGAGGLQLPPQHRAGPSSTAARLPATSASVASQSRHSQGSESENSSLPSEDPGPSRNDPSLGRELDAELLANFRAARDHERGQESSLERAYEKERILHNHLALRELENEQHMLRAELEDQEDELDKLDSELQDDLEDLKECLEKTLIPGVTRCEGMHNEILRYAEALSQLQNEVELIVPDVVAGSIEDLMQRVDSVGKDTEMKVETAVQTFLDKRRIASASRYLPRWMVKRLALVASLLEQALALSSWAAPDPTDRPDDEEDYDDQDGEGFRADAGDENGKTGVSDEEDNEDADLDHDELKIKTGNDPGRGPLGGSRWASARPGGGLRSHTSDDVAETGGALAMLFMVAGLCAHLLVKAVKFGVVGVVVAFFLASVFLPQDAEPAAA